MPTDLDLRFILPGPIQCQRKYPEILTCLTDLNPRRHLALPNTDRPLRTMRGRCLTSLVRNSLPPPARADTVIFAAESRTPVETESSPEQPTTNTASNNP